jgi:hypothetical protein
MDSLANHEHDCSLRWPSGAPESHGAKGRLRERRVLGSPLADSASLGVPSADTVRYRRILVSHTSSPMGDCCHLGAARVSLRARCSSKSIGSTGARGAPAKRLCRPIPGRGSGRMARRRSLESDVARVLRTDLWPVGIPVGCQRTLPPQGGAGIEIVQRSQWARISQRSSSSPSMQRRGPVDRVPRAGGRGQDGTSRCRAPTRCAACRDGWIAFGRSFAAGRHGPSCCWRRRSDATPYGAAAPAGLAVAGGAAGAGPGTVPAGATEAGGGQPPAQPPPRAR